MVKVCKRCEILEKHKYWNEFPATKHGFFKVMLVDFEHQLRIPRKFRDCFKGQLSKQCSLRGPSGNKWRVRIEETPDDIFFTGGWECFVRDNGLTVSDFLVFRYDGYSSFNVSIYDSTGCEREGSHFAKNQSLLLQSGCTSTLHSNRIIDSSEHMPADQETDISIEAAGSDEQTSDSSSQELKTNRKKGNPPKKRKNAAANIVKGKRLDMSKSKGKKKVSSVLEESDMSEKEEGEEEEEERSWSGESEKQNLRFSPNARIGATSKAKQPKMFYISNRRTPSEQEKQRAYAMALDHMIRSKPTGARMVDITMLPTHVYVGFNLTIPKEWALKNMLGEAHDVVLKVPGVDESWTVGCRWTSSQQCQIRARWPKFVLENNVEENDVCVFELIEKGESGGRRNAEFKVHIFRAVAELAPLTVSKGVI